MIRRLAAALLPALLAAQIPTSKQQSDKLVALVAASPKLNLTPQDLPVQAPSNEFGIDMVSSVAVDRAGLIYAFQRGAKADPVLVFDPSGKLIRSFGKGLYKIPHSIRIDPDGNVWTVDAESSMVYKHTPEGRELLRIEVGGQPANHRSNFKGTTDICFGPNGRIFISDGYGNARVLEYTAAGKRVKEWSHHGTGDGEMFVPHGIAIDSQGTLFVADRENGRIQRFTMDGKFLGLWDHLGKTFSITITGNDELWIGTQPRTSPNGQDGWILKIDKKTGRILGHVPSPGTHSMALVKPGEPIVGARPDHIVWFREFPTAEIGNGLVTAKFFLPDATRGYYRGTRFDWSGNTYSLRTRTHEYFGQWFPKYDPKLHDAIMGPVEEFRTADGGLGYAAAKPGETFVRIGVGVVRKPEEKAYQSFRTYDIVDPGQWKTTAGRDRIRFTHTLKDATGYAYQYTKTIRLVKGEPRMIIEHELRNTGSKEIRAQQYNHNFFVMDGQPTGPATWVKFPFDLKPVRPFAAGLAETRGSEIHYLKELATGQSVFGEFEGSNAPSAYDLKLENRKAGAGVRIRGDRPIAKVVYWSIRTVFSPEPYIDIEAAPGKTFRWTYTYDFYDVK